MIFNSIVIFCNFQLPWLVLNRYSESLYFATMIHFIVAKTESLIFKMILWRPQQYLIWCCMLLRWYRTFMLNWIFLLTKTKRWTTVYKLRATFIRWVSFYFSCHKTRLLISIWTVWILSCCYNGFINSHLNIKLLCIWYCWFFIPIHNTIIDSYKKRIILKWKT